MIGIVVVAHNPNLSEEIIRFCKDLKKDSFKLINGGGTGNDKIFGTCPRVIQNAVEQADQGDGVIVLCDLGSSVLNAQKAKKNIGDKIRVEIVDAPIVEGTIVAVSANSPKIKMEELIDFIREAKAFPKL